uniref:non-specific serine/threonine protein kinase n=1 Tax=Thermosporothrix sp. COM3 TaxID=2490863 RepID=A0A455SM94_9CHLR|nr:hypothetical protein KTC_32390 [Thermosporothrix sp. COM3]
MVSRDNRTVGGVYRLGQLVQKNGVYAFYTAYNRNNNDVVGLWIVDFPPQMQPQAVQSLLQPLASRRALESPHVLRVYDWGIEGNRIYIATDPPRGMTLRYVMDNENVGIERSLNLAQQMVMGIKALHERGFVGLDLRPRLVTVDSMEVETIGIEDRVQLDDIGLRGLLKALGYGEPTSVEDLGAFDTRYASPEQIAGQPITVASDLYQAGLVLFELIAGRLPFVGQNMAETGILQTTGSIPRLRQYVHNAPAMLQDVLNYVLAKDPARRFSNATALLNALQNVKAQIQVNPVEIQNTILEPKQTGGFTREMKTFDSGELPNEEVLKNLGQPSGAMSVVSASEVYANLRYERDGKVLLRLPIRQKNVIVGRRDPKRGFTPDIDLTRLDPQMTVSRQHARIRFEETFFYIEDLKSRNKTRLGELTLAPLKAELVQHGDWICFGSVRLRFEIPGMSTLKPEKREEEQ